MGLLVAAGALLTNPLWSQPAIDARSTMDGPLVSDRSRFTDSASTIRQGRFQIEGGVGYGLVDETETLVFGEALLRVGLSEHWELRLSPGSLTKVNPHGRGDRSGISDASVGAKLRLTDAVQGLPEAAILFAATIPTGSGSIGNGSWQPSATLALGWVVAERFSIGANLGFSHVLDNERRFDRVTGSLALSVDLNPKVDGFIEAYGFTREERGGPTTHYLNTGLIYTVNSELKFDARLGLGLNEIDPEFFVGFGASARW